MSIQHKTMFERLLEAAERTGDITLRNMYQKEMFTQELFASYERERLVQEIADLVISRIHATVDVTEVFAAIDELNNKLDSLAR